MYIEWKKERGAFVWFVFRTFFRWLLERSLTDWVRFVAGAFFAWKTAEHYESIWFGLLSWYPWLVVIGFVQGLFIGLMSGSSNFVESRDSGSCRQTCFLDDFCDGVLGLFSLVFLMFVVLVVTVALYEAFKA